MEYPIGIPVVLTSDNRSDLKDQLKETEKKQKSPKIYIGITLDPSSMDPPLQTVILKHQKFINHSCAVTQGSTI